MSCKTIVRAWMLLSVSTMLVGSPPPLQAAGVPCKKVVEELDRIVSRHGSEAADAFRVSRRLRVDRLWVERCAEVYGRRLRHTASTSDLEREKYEEGRESQEPEEVGREERGAGEEPLAEAAEEQERRSRVQKIPPTMHEWDPALSNEWDPVFRPDWAPFVREENE